MVEQTVLAYRLHHNLSNIESSHICGYELMPGFFCRHKCAMAFLGDHLYLVGGFGSHSENIRSDSIGRSVDRLNLKTVRLHFPPFIGIIFHMLILVLQLFWMKKRFQTA